MVNLFQGSTAPELLSSLDANWEIQIGEMEEVVDVLVGAAI
ncbi:MAG: hypothetical protein AAFU57_18485 [Bacteroidota bacterium]